VVAPKEIVLRSYWYVNVGKGINPEAGVGVHAHTLENLRDRKGERF